MLRTHVGTRNIINMTNIMNRNTVFFKCRKEGSECNLDELLRNAKHTTTGSDMKNCFTINNLLGASMDEASSQGIENGLTMILLTGKYYWICV